MAGRQREDGGELAISPQLRQELGLSEDESLRCVARGGRTLVLERHRADSPPLSCEGCELVLTTEVHAFSLAEILGWVHAARKSGLLAFGYRDHEKAVYFHGGEVVFASSNQRVDRLGECLLRAGVITVAQLRTAEQRFDPSERFGKVLVEQGFLTPRELWQGVKDQVEEVVRSLFAYEAGTVHFWQGAVQPDNVVRLSLPTERLVAEGLQRREELRKFLAVLEDPRVRLMSVDGASSKLAGAERDLYESLATERSFKEVCRRLHLDALSGARTVQLLRLVGAVKLVRGGDDPDEAVEHAALRDCVEGHVKLVGELVAPIVALVGAEGIQVRMASVLDELRPRFPELLEGIELGPGATLDPVCIEDRARRLGEAARAQVTAALGELVSYLEFELRNHPQIDQPEFFLERLAELRATLDS